MKTVFVLYPDMTALDIVGPYEIISRWPDADVHFLARSLEPVRCDEGLTLIPTDTPTTLPDPELIVVPGSSKPVQVLSDGVLIDWLRTAAPKCRWTASVCTGAGLYAAAGLLEGKATTRYLLKSGRQDLNLRPPGPQPGALPDCATPRVGREQFYDPPTNAERRCRASRASPA